MANVYWFSINWMEWAIEHARLSQNPTHILWSPIYSYKYILHRDACTVVSPLFVHVARVSKAHREWENQVLDWVFAGEEYEEHGIWIFVMDFFMKNIFVFVECGCCSFFSFACFAHSVECACWACCAYVEYIECWCAAKAAAAACAISFVAIPVVCLLLNPMNGTHLTGALEWSIFVLCIVHMSHALLFLYIYSMRPPVASQYLQS